MKLQNYRASGKAEAVIMVTMEDGTQHLEEIAELFKEYKAYIAFHPMKNGRDCEFKRLFTRPEFRGQHVGRALFARALADAEALGYEHAYLDTLQRLEAANVMYQKFGFHKIPAYYYNPLPGVVYYRYDFPAGKKTAELKEAV
jgi:GNAT superfamily N-acetyltransferase